MKVWKSIPSWFRLDNYDKSINFTAKEWYVEIMSRIWYTNQVYHNVPYPEDRKNKSLEYIKNYTFFSRKESEYIYTSDITDDDAEFLRELELRKLELREYFATKTFSANNVKELNELTAYSFFLDSDKKEEIEKDFAALDDYDSSNFWSEKRKSEREKRNKIIDKYKGPIAKAYIDAESSRYLEVDMGASDEKILADFKTWLLNTRSDMGDKYLKRDFSSNDFKDWHESRLLPYWDLTEIARNENATIPFHVLGAALFPNEYGIDLTERVRKVTKRKCQQIFSCEAVLVLEQQRLENI